MNESLRIVCCRAPNGALVTGELVDFIDGAGLTAVVRCGRWTFQVDDVDATWFRRRGRHLADERRVSSDVPAEIRQTMEDAAALLRRSVS